MTPLVRFLILCGLLSIVLSTYGALTNVLGMF